MSCIILRQMDQRLLAPPTPNALFELVEVCCGCHDLRGIHAVFFYPDLCWFTVYCPIVCWTTPSMHDMAALGWYCSHTCLANILKFDSCLQALVKIIHRVAAILDYGTTKSLSSFDTKWQCHGFRCSIISWRRQFGHSIENLFVTWYLCGYLSVTWYFANLHLRDVN